MQDESLRISYLKCQETFLIDVVRRCLEAESKISILQSTIVSKDNDINALLENQEQLKAQISQLLAGLDATTAERDRYRDEHSNYRDEILALGDLKEKCEKIEKNFEEHMANYNLVNQAYQKLSEDYAQLKSEHETLLKFDDKPNSKAKQKKEDWS